MIQILDNFYTNPDYVTTKLTGEYPIHGCGTGNRSVSLREIDEHMYWDLYSSLCSMFNIDSQKHFFTSFFMEHHYSMDNPYNRGWVHIDGKDPSVCRMTIDEYKVVQCGQIFLTKNPDPETGINLCALKSDVKWTTQELIDKTINNYTEPKEKLDAGIITVDEYKDLYEQYHSNFDVTCEVKHTYNRMVSWKGGTLHGTKFQTSSKMPTRLTQYWFITKL